MPSRSCFAASDMLDLTEAVAMVSSSQEALQLGHDPEAAKATTEEDEVPAAQDDPDTEPEMAAAAEEDIGDARAK